MICDPPLRHFKQHLFYAKSLLNTVGKARSSPDEMVDHVKGGALRSRGIVALMASKGRRPKRTLGEGKGETRRTERDSSANLHFKLYALLTPMIERSRTEPMRRECHLSERVLLLQRSACRLSFWFGSPSLSKLASRRSGFGPFDIL